MNEWMNNPMGFEWAFLYFIQIHLISIIHYLISICHIGRLGKKNHINLIIYFQISGISENIYIEY